jgi:hypothetical protein
MTEPDTPPTDEYETFRRLAQKLVRVPRKEVKDKLDAERAGKANGDRRPKRRRPI